MVPLSERDILFFLYALKKADADDLKYQRMLINVFVSSIYLYDDKITYFFNSSDKTVEITEDLFAEVTASDTDYRCSFNEASAPPKIDKF